MPSIKRSLAIGLAIMAVSGELRASDPIEQKQERLKDIQRQIDEKKREIENTEDEARQLKESLENARGSLDRTQQSLTNTHQKKMLVQRKARVQSQSLRKTVATQEVNRQQLTQLWASYEKSVLAKSEKAPEKPRLLAMVLASQTQTYERISQRAGELKVRVESLKSESHQLTREEYETERQKIQALKAYREGNARYTKVEARKEALKSEIHGLEETAAQLTSLVNSLRRKKALKEAKTAGEASAVAPPVPEKLPLREASLPWPISGTVIKKFGKRIQPEMGTPVVSNGLLISCPPGNPVRSVADGKVLYAGPFMSYGRIVLVEHPGDWHSIYGQLEESLTPPETNVKTGDTLGRSGTHVYFEIRIHGKPVDPLPWLTSR